jgi:hypothetical protein
MAEAAAKTPSDRMPATAALTFQFICTFQRMGTGRRAKTTSVRAATLELKNAANLRCDGGMHVPSTDESQVKASGRHWKKTVTAPQSDLAHMCTISTPLEQQLHLQRLPV